MRKYTLAALSFILFVFTVLPVAQPVAVKAAEPDALKDGDYTIGLDVLHAEKDEASSMNRFIQTPASLTVKDGEKRISLVLTNNEDITAFQIEQDGEFVDADVVSTDVEGNKRTVAFAVEDLSAIKNAKVKVYVASANHTGNYDVRLKFDQESIQLVNPSPKDPDPEEPAPVEPTPEEPEEPEQPKPENPQPEVIKDGDYTIGLNVLHAEKDEASSMNRFIQTPASLTVKDGKKRISLVLTNNEDITAFQIEQDGKFVDADVDSTDVEGNKRTVAFAVEDLSIIKNAKVKVYVAAANHTGNYDVRLKFDQESIQPANPSPESPNPEEPTPEEPTPEEPGKPEQPKPENPKPENPKPDGIENGEYTIGVNVLKADSEESSVAGDYIQTPAFLSVKDGKKEISLVLTDHQSITGFQVEKDGKFTDAKVISKDEKANTRTIAFEVEDLGQIVNANIQVEVAMANYRGNYDIRLAFDRASIKPVKDVIPNLPSKPGKPSTPKPSTQNPKDPNNGNQNNGSSEPVDPRNLKDGHYSIEFKVLKSDSDDLSMMNDYVVSPGSLTVKDGKKSVAVTLTNSSWITDFKVLKGAAFVDPKLLVEKKNADTRVVEFEVEDLFAKLNAKTEVNIPELNYHSSYDVRFAFDTESIRGSDGNINNTNNGNNGATPPPAKVSGQNNNDDNLKFNRDGDLSGQKVVKADAGKMGLNPKTADTTKMILFGLLFILSLVPLVAKYRRQRNLQ